MTCGSRVQPRGAGRWSLRCLPHTSALPRPSRDQKYLDFYSQWEGEMIYEACSERLGRV